MDYQALRAADAEIGIPDLQAAADALNAQTVTATRDVPASEARAIILPTGEWAAIKLLSERRDFDKVPQQVVVAAMSAMGTFDGDVVVRGSSDTAWNAIAGMLGAFVASGVLSTASRDAILALRRETRPAWSPPVTAGDIQTARAQETP